MNEFLFEINRSILWQNWLSSPTYDTFRPWRVIQIQVIRIQLIFIRRSTDSSFHQIIFKCMAKLLQSFNLYTKWNQMISRLIMSGLRATAASGPLALNVSNTHHHAHVSLSVSISFWRGTETRFRQEPPISRSSKPAQIFGKVIGYGREVPAWSHWDRFDSRPNAAWLWAASGRGKLRAS